MAMGTSTKSPSSNFLCQVLTLPAKNTKLSLSLFTIIILINFASIVCNYFTAQAPSTGIDLKAEALVDTGKTSPADYPVLIAAIRKETNELSTQVIIYTVIFFFINSFLRITTFFAAAVTYSGELLTLGEVLVTTKNNIKGPMITHFWGMFVGLLCSLPLIILIIVIFPLFIKNEGSYTSITFSVLALVFALLALLLLIYLAIVWSLSMVVAVVETGCYGPRAFGRAAKLAKEEKMKGFLIILVSGLLVGALYTIYKMSLKYNSSSTAFVLLLGFLYTVFGQLVEMYTLVAAVVYYYECRKSQEEGGEDEEDKVVSASFAYESLPAKATHVDEELP